MCGTRHFCKACLFQPLDQRPDVANSEFDFDFLGHAAILVAHSPLALKKSRSLPLESADTSLQLYSLFRPEVEQLEALLNRDLSEWKLGEDIARPQPMAA